MSGSDFSWWSALWQLIACSLVDRCVSTSSPRGVLDYRVLGTKYADTRIPSDDKPFSARFRVPLRLRLLVQPSTFFHLEDVKIAREVRRAPVSSEIEFVEKAKCRRLTEDDIDSLRGVTDDIASDPNEQAGVVEVQAGDVRPPMDWLAFAEGFSFKLHVDSRDMDVR